MEQGTGKTFPVLFRLYELIRSKRVRSVLIVAPNAVCSSWEDKISQLEPNMRKSFESVEFETVSYDLLWRREYYFKNSWDAVVFDESHFIKSPTAKRTKACLRIAAKAKYRYILTGTPTSNGALCNLWSQFAAITPEAESETRIYPACFEGLSYYQWLDKYAYLNKYYQPYRYKRVSEIQAVIDEYSYRITKDECLDLPEKLPDVIWHMQLDKKARKDYRAIVKSSAIVDKDLLAENPLVRALKLRQICSGFVSTDEGTDEYKCSKISALSDYLIDNDKKIVIFCEFTHSIDVVSELLEKKKIKHVILDGRQQDKAIWRTFQNDPKCQVIICQYQSGSAGIDLFAADTMIFFEPTRSSNLHEQARDRIHRPGQNRACSYIYMLTDKTIEVEMYNALINYSDFNEALFTQYIESYTKGGDIEYESE